MVRNEKLIAGLIISLLALVILLSYQIILEDEIPFEEFRWFMGKYQKFYSSTSELKHRYQIYSENLSFIRNFNAQHKSWKLSVNQYADMSQEEFVQAHLSSIGPSDIPYDYSISDSSIHDEIDWRERGVVTGVKDQGNCASGWAFASAGAIEAVKSIDGEPSVSLSTQQLIDCSELYGNKGCDHGNIGNSFQYVRDYGLTTATNYPYKARTNSCEAYKTTYVSANIQGFVRIMPNSSNSLLQRLNIQPVSVSIKASSLHWMFYSAGIIDEDCGSDTNHAVLVTGYQLYDNFYWVKNSWGVHWGIDGYAKIAILNGPGICGIHTMPFFPYT